VAVETLGVWGREAALLVGEIGRRQVVALGDPWAGSFLMQRISIAIQRGKCHLGDEYDGSGPPAGKGLLARGVASGFIF